VQLRDLARAFVRQGHELTVLLPAADLAGHWAEERVDGAKIMRLKAPATKDIGYIRRTLGEWRMPYAMRRALGQSPLADARWDGVIWYSPSIFHAPLVRTVKARSRCKSYLIIRDIFPEWAVDLGLMRKGPPYQFFKLIARRQYDSADIIGVQTPGNTGYFRHWQQEQPGRKLEVLQNWLDAPGRIPCRIRVKDSALSGRKVFVYAGNMGVAQSMDILLDLAQSLQQRSDLGFLFVGRGSDAARLAKEATARGLDNVLFYDEIEPDEIPDLYAQCHAGLVALDPRHKSHNIPGKFLTYMQSGLPVLANVNAGNDLAELMRREGVGSVCESHQLRDLQAGCLALLAQIERDPDLSGRCTGLFARCFAADGAVRQIVSALSPP
jgi:hypothetical protein